MATCPEMVGRGAINFGCYLDAGHDGPHAARENAPSMAERARWEEAQIERKARADLAMTQGPAQTTAERYTDGALPHPSAETKCDFQYGDGEACQWVGMVKELSSHQHCPVQSPDRSCHFVGSSGELAQHLPEHAVNPVKESAPVAEGDFGTQFSQLGEAIRDRARERAGVSGEEPVPPEIEQQLRAGVPQPSAMVPDGVQPGSELRERPEDQPLPQPVEGGSYMHDLVAQDLAERLALGIKRYGTGLQAFNGRRSFLDFYQELLDATVYARQALTELSGLASMLDELDTLFTQGEGRLAYLRDKEGGGLEAVQIDATRAREIVGILRTVIGNV